MEYMHSVCIFECFICNVSWAFGTALPQINNTGFIDIETNYQSGEDTPVGYNATVISGIVFDGNRAIGGGVGASFICDAHDACANITVKNTFVKNSQDPWRCKYIKSFTTSNNTGEQALRTTPLVLETTRI